MAIERVTGSAAFQAANSAVQANKAVETVAPVMNVQTQNVVQTQQTTAEHKEGEGRKEPSNESIKKAVSDLNKKMSNTTCQFGIHEGTNRVTIKIVDKETKDVLKEFPAEETLEMIEKAWELAGIMVDKKL